MRLNYKWSCTLTFFTIFLASIFSYYYSTKGFAGFDLSPMISENHTLKNGIGRDFFIDNPMPPGFLFIVSLYTSLLGNSYGSYFIGNALFVASLVVSVAAFLFFPVRQKLIDQTIASYIILGVSLSVVPTLLTDGHFYISDTSNLIGIYSIVVSNLLFYLTLCKIDLKSKNLAFLLVAIGISIGLLPLMRLNSGILSLVLSIGFVVLSIFRTESLSGKVYILCGIVIVSSLTFLGVMLYTGTTLSSYVSTLRNVAQHRAGLNFDLLRFALRTNSPEQLQGSVNFAFYYLLVTTTVYISLKNLRDNWSVHKALIFPVFFVFFVFNLQTAVPSSVLVIFSFLIFGLLTILGERNNSYLNYIYASSFVLLTLSSLVCMSQNFDVKSSDSPFILLAFTGFCFYAYSRNFISTNGLFLIFFLINMPFVIEGISRDKILLAGPPSAYRDFNSLLKNNFFSIKTSNYHLASQNRIDSISTECKRVASCSLIFGPRLEYNYQAQQMLPPAGFPLWWHFNTSYSAQSVDGIRKSICSLSVGTEFIFSQINNQPDTALMDESTKSTIFDSNLFDVISNDEYILVLSRNSLPCH